MTSEELIRFIDIAFDGVPQAKEITLHVAEAYDNHDIFRDEAHRRNDYFGPWQNVPTEHMNECQWGLPFLDEVGFRFYLPAFMIWYIRAALGASYYEPALDFPLYALDMHIDSPGLHEHKKKQFLLFSREQLRACALFVRWCAQDKSGEIDACKANDLWLNYWWQYA